MEILEIRVLARLAVAVFTFAVSMVSLGSSILCSYLWRTWSSGLIILSIVYYSVKRKRGRSRRPCSRPEITIFKEAVREARAF